MKKNISLSLTVLLAIVLYKSIPVYQFYAHQNKLPMPFWGFDAIPGQSPTDQQIYDPFYTQAANKSLIQLEQHKKTIQTPALSAAVAINNRLVWAGSVGWADIEREQVASVNTQFRIGSTSKALTSAGLAKLVEAGKISLDTPIEQVLKPLPNPDWKGITPRQLSSHMAGIPHYKENTDAVGLYRTLTLNRHYKDVETALDIFDQSKLLFPRGEDFHYSSLGIVLLSAMMQKAAGVPFQQWMQQQVFDPLNMSATTPEPIKSPGPNMAQFYWHNQVAPDQVRPWRKVDLSHRLASGDFISTPSDLVRLGLGFINPDFIKTDIQQQFWTAQRLNNGEMNEQHYAIGWRIHDQDFGPGIGTLMTANHGGVSRGSQCWLMIVPDYKLVVAININANTDEFWDFAQISTSLVQNFVEAFLQQQ